MLDQYPIKALTPSFSWMKISKQQLFYQWLLKLPSHLYTLASDYSNESSATGSEKKADTTKSFSFSY